ncbi:3'-5' exonuclease [Streptomyces sp. SS1-1]|uniref:3'-5' exonuclease n=1 Tax=Streptomyces sp. SS1-1 TaxID=2651869 RepID=UPI0012509F64|nr:3'-5' exonuclease [Streptomyces sp. SS1-1]KAB2975993.1 3'-5' exonuclease [Streptomyces sp. SS1-1]
MSAPIAFVDCETTGLDPIRHMPWEVAIIRREPDGTETEYLWQIRPTRAELAAAQPEALRIGGYAERFAVPDGAAAADMLAVPVVPLDYLDVAGRIFKALTGAVMVGSNPHFDASFLHRMLQTGATPWHYRPVCIATLAAGRKLGMTEMVRRVGGTAQPSDEVPFPFSSRDLSRWAGVEPPGPGVAHTALGDARWARDVFDAVRGETS